jgi:hypothetical protein
MDMKENKWRLSPQRAADQSARGGEVARGSYGRNGDDDFVLLVQMCSAMLPGSPRLSRIAGYLNAAELVAPERWDRESLGWQIHDRSRGRTPAAFGVRPGLLSVAGYASDVADSVDVRMGCSVTLIN